MGGTVSTSMRAAIEAAQGMAGDVAAQWRAEPAMAALAAAYAACPADDPDAAADIAEAAMGDTAWTGTLIARLVAALARMPFFEPPLRCHRDARRSSLILFEAPAVTLTASVVRPGGSIGDTIVFPGRRSVTRYLRTGGGTLARWTAPPIGDRFDARDAPPCRALPPLRIADGEIVRTDGRIEAKRLTGASRDAVTLTASIRAGAEPLLREYRIADGALIRAASADEGASRTEMLLTFLRAAGRADAAEAFDAASRDDAFQLRWAAMREWLALDARTALPRLAQMASDDAEPQVRAAAAATLARVQARLGESPCLA